MKILSAEWLELEEQRRREDARLHGVEPAPRYTSRDLVIEVIHGTNRADLSVIEGTCDPVIESKE